MTNKQVSAYLDEMLRDAKMYYTNTAVTLYLDNDTQIEVGYAIEYAIEYSSFYWSHGTYGRHSLNDVIKEVIEYLNRHNLHVTKAEEV